MPANECKGSKCAQEKRENELAEALKCLKECDSHRIPSNDAERQIMT